MKLKLNIPHGRIPVCYTDSCLCRKLSTGCATVVQNLCIMAKLRDRGKRQNCTKIALRKVAIFSFAHTYVRSRTCVC